LTGVFVLKEVGGSCHAPIVTASRYDSRLALGHQQKLDHSLCSAILK